MTAATDAFSRLHPSLQYHVVNTLGFRDLRPVQAATTGPILDGENLVVLAPTAGGKTEAAFFPLLSAILTEGRPPVSTLYVSPLRALLNNQEDRVERLCGMVGRRAFKWHGDVPARARQELQKDPADVLLTTPESLEVMLLSAKVAAATLFTHVRAIVIDEVHAFAADDRGAHLMALLERIVVFARHDVQRIGLSATVGNPTEILGWLQGSSRRPGRVVDPPRPSGAAPEVHLDYVGSLDIAARFTCEMHLGTKRLVFCDSRGQSEELCAILREKGANAHVVHSSLSLGERERAERALVTDPDVVVVATSALELGIDIGDLDHVYQVGCPSTVAAFLQRMGRTGRRPGLHASFTFLTLERKQHLSLLQAAGLLRLWRAGFVEPVQPSRRAFHVLVHQLLALALQEEGVPRSDWWRWIADATPFHEITVAERETLVAHLLERQILISDGVRLILGPEGERLYGGKNFLELYGVFDSPPSLAVVHGNTTIGHLDTMFVLQRERRPAVFALAGRSWRIKHVDWKRRQAHVEPSTEAGKSAWTGTPLDLSWELCQAMRSVLTDEGKDPGWTRRTAQMIDALRADQAFLRGPTPVRDASTGVEWWSFAGNRANAVLALELEARLGVGAAVTWDNLRINVTGQLSAQAVHAAIEAMRGGIDKARAQAFAVTAARGRLSRFQPCLPQALEGAFLAERVVDVRAAQKTVGAAVGEEPARAAREPAAGSLPVPRAMRRLVEEKARGSDDETPTPVPASDLAGRSTGASAGGDPPVSPRPMPGDAPPPVIEKAVARLRRGLDAHFPAPRPPSPEGSEREQRKEWTSELVVGSDGQVAIETSPLAGLPGFVKRLEVRAGDAHVTPVIASNLRTQRWHTPVSPSAAGYTWSASGFEDELDEDLARLNQAGVDVASVTAFLVDAGGVGRRADGPLRRGRTYRLVLPPAVQLDSGALPTTNLGDGWRSAEVEVPERPRSPQEQALERMGLRMAAVEATLTWIGAPPLRHERGHRGARWAVFTLGAAPLLEVSLPPGTRGTVLVVGEGPGQEVRLEELEGRALVELGELEQGRFVAELLTGDDSGGARLPFVVVRDEGPRLPTARFVVRLRQRDVQVTGVQRVRRDLGTMVPEDLELRAPPLWTVRAGWSGLADVEAEPLVASEDGTIDGGPLVERFASLWKTERRGDLWLDAGDLGRLVVQHTATPDPAALRQRLRALRNERHAAWVNAREDLALAHRLWIDPILTLLGYRTRIATEDAERAPPGCLGLLLEEAVRRRGQVSSAVTRAAILTKPGADLARLDEGTPRGFAAWLCERHGVTQAILTDGTHWTVHQEGRALAPPPVDLLAALDEPRAFESFLWHFLSEAS